MNVGHATNEMLYVRFSCLWNISCLRSFADFKIEEFCELLSDTHSPIVLKIRRKKVSRPASDERTPSPDPGRDASYSFTWNDECKNEFTSSLDDDLLSSLSSTLEDLEASPTAEGVNNLANKLSEAFVKVAEQTGAFKKRPARRRRRFIAHKPWFD